MLAWGGGNGNILDHIERYSLDSVSQATRSVSRHPNAFSFVKLILKFKTLIFFSFVEEIRSNVAFSSPLKA